MVIHKILNNNLILSRDGQGHEVIVKGCGIAFQKKKGQQVEESRIEKIFTAENAQISKEIQGYLTAIPEKYLDFVEAFVNDVKEKEGTKLLHDCGMELPKHTFYSEYGRQKSYHSYSGYRSGQADRLF